MSELELAAAPDDDREVDSDLEDNKVLAVGGLATRLSLTHKAPASVERKSLLGGGQHGTFNGVDLLRSVSTGGREGPSRVDGKFHLLTNNVWMLPGLVGKLLSRHRSKRARNVIEAISQGSTAPGSYDHSGLGAPFDIVCLQEVFYEKGRRILTEGLREQGYEVVPHICPSNNCFVICSGLFFASKFPILFHSSEQYKLRAKSTADNWANKGVFGAVLDASECSPGLRVVVFLTHPQAQDMPEVRKEQLKQAEDFMHRFVRDSIAMHKKSNAAKARFAVILTGDLNFDGESDEYFDAVEVLGTPRDLFREMHENPKAKPGNTWNGMPNQSGYLSMRLDYVLAYDKLPRVTEPLEHLRCTYAETLINPPWEGTSDHAPIEVELRVAVPDDDDDE